MKKGEAEADCLTAAHSVYECTVCHRTVNADFTGEPAPSKHSLKQVEDAVEPTCTNSGNTAAYLCEVCGKAFDSEDATRRVWSDDDIIVLPLGHDMDDNAVCRRCQLADLRYKFLNLTGVAAIIEDNDSNPWTLTDENDPSKGLVCGNKGIKDSMSRFAIHLCSEKAFRLELGGKLLSSSDSDVLYVYIGCEEPDVRSGAQEFTTTSYLSAGEHYVTFEFRKNGTNVSEDGTAWLTALTATTALDDEEKADMICPVVVYNYIDKSMTWKALDIGAKVPVYEEVFEIDLDNEDNSYDLPSWCGYMDEVKTIRIDESFSQFRPKSVLAWFAYAPVFVEGLQNLNTSETEDFYGMFYGNTVSSIDVSTFDTGMGANFRDMFAGCISLEELDLTSFDMGNALYTTSMFNGCCNLEKIYVNKSFCASVTTGNSLGMFADCIFLGGAKLYESGATDAAMANYRDGYLRTYYKVGNERFDLCGDMTVDELNLEEGKAFMTHDAFTARKASHQRTVSGEQNIYRIGTVCLPYAVAASGDYTLYAVKQVADGDITRSGRLRGDINTGTLLLERVDGTLPAGVPAVFKANGDVVSFKAVDAAVVEQPADDESLAKDGWLLSGAFTGYDVDEGYALSGGDFVSVASLKGDAETLRMSPMTAWLKALNGASLAADHLSVASTDGVLTSIAAIDALAKGKAQIYDTNGVRLDTLKSGVNIIRHADGSAQKVIVK